MVRIGRRVVTGVNAGGRSVVLEDRPAPSSTGAGLNLTRLWYANGLKALTPAASDALKVKMETPPGESYFLIGEIKPEDPAMTRDDLEKYVAARFEVMGAPHLRRNTERHPRMHRTPTIDYVIVLQGTVRLLFDEGEVTLKPFDVVVQQATNHAWVNDGPETVVIAAVLVGLAEGR